VKPTIVVSPGVPEAVRASAERVVSIAREAVAARGKFSLALAGGSTPKALYQLLASDEFRTQIDWSKAHIFFGDERAVPTHHEYSNARMAREALLDHVPIPRDSIEIHGGLMLPILMLPRAPTKCTCAMSPDNST
jgi:6-phosphogluconolactonase